MVCDEFGASLQRWLGCDVGGARHVIGADVDFTDALSAVVRLLLLLTLLLILCSAASLSLTHFVERLSTPRAHQQIEVDEESLDERLEDIERRLSMAKLESFKRRVGSRSSRANRLSKVHEAESEHAVFAADEYLMAEEGKRRGEAAEALSEQRHSQLDSERQHNSDGSLPSPPALTSPTRSEPASPTYSERLDAKQRASLATFQRQYTAAAAPTRKEGEWLQRTLWSWQVEHKPRALAEEQAADYDAALLNDDAAWILAEEVARDGEADPPPTPLRALPSPTKLRPRRAVDSRQARANPVVWANSARSQADFEHQLAELELHLVSSQEAGASAETLRRMRAQWIAEHDDHAATRRRSMKLGNILSASGREAPPGREEGREAGGREGRRQNSRVAGQERRRRWTGTDGSHGGSVTCGGSAVSAAVTSGGAGALVGPLVVIPAPHPWRTRRVIGVGSSVGSSQRPGGTPCGALCGAHEVEEQSKRVSCDDDECSSSSGLSLLSCGVAQSHSSQFRCGDG